MIARHENKKLVRIIKRMVEKNLSLTRQADQSYAAKPNGKTSIRLNSKTAREACSLGVLNESADHRTLTINAQTHKWLERQNATGADNAFAAQHRDMHTVHLIDEQGKLFAARRNAAESPLAWLRRRSGADRVPFLSAAEFAAAEKLRDDYTRSSLAQKLCVDWGAPIQGSCAQGPRNAVLDAADGAIAAKDRFMQALQCLGPGLDDLVFCLCIREINLEAIEKTRRWPKRTAKIILKISLDRLAKHYGLQN